VRSTQTVHVFLWHLNDVSRIRVYGLPVHFLSIVMILPRSSVCKMETKIWWSGRRPQMWMAPSPRRGIRVSGDTLGSAQANFAWNS